MARWEKVADGGDEHALGKGTYRIRVEDGYLYRYSGSICFVPDAPAQVTGPPDSGVVVMPSFHRPAKAPSVGREYIDVEYTPVADDEVNGSKVTDLTPA